MTDTSRKRGYGATHCYGCVCDTCSNSVELPIWNFTAGESSEPCFSCDECRHYDSDCKKRSQWRESCPQYVEAKKAVEARARETERRAKRERERREQAFRAAFKAVEGGKDRV